MSGRSRHRRSPVNGAVRWAVHTPGLRRLIDEWVCELRSAGVRTGRYIALPVMYAEGDDRPVILVGRSRCKRWWRDFDHQRAVLTVQRGPLDLAEQPR